MTELRTDLRPSHATRAWRAAHLAGPPSATPVPPTAASGPPTDASAPVAVASGPAASVAAASSPTAALAAASGRTAAVAAASGPAAPVAAASGPAAAASGRTAALAAVPGSTAALAAASGRTAAVAAASGRAGRVSVAAVAMGVAAIAMVGGSVAISGVLASAPMLTAEAIRYAVACLLLVLFARLAGQRVTVPRGTEWLWLGGVALTGLVLFNIALVLGSGHAEPAVLGVSVACVPPLLAVLGPLADRTRTSRPSGTGLADRNRTSRPGRTELADRNQPSRLSRAGLAGRNQPSRAVLAAALVVTCGAALVTGLGRTDAVGVIWAAVVCGCDAAFTLLAMPVLGRHGAWGVSVHATWIAAVLYGVAGLVHEGPGAVTRLRPDDWLAVGYLAVITAAAFVLWYSAVGRLGASRAGLLGGVAPISAAIVGVLLGGPAPRPLVWVGVAVVLSGLALGLRAGSPARPLTPARPAEGTVQAPTPDPPSGSTHEKVS